MIDQCAGIIGIDPEPFTLRSLLRMADARQRTAWDKLSWLAAIVVNCQRTAKDRMFKPSELNPYTAEQTKKADKLSDVRALAAMFGAGELK